MHTPRRLLVALISLFAITVAGCIEFGEDIWINADGSGRIRLDIAFPQAFLTMGQTVGVPDTSSDNFSNKFKALKNVYAKDSRVTHVELNDSAVGDMHHFYFDIAARSHADLPDLHRLLFADSSMQNPDTSEGRPELHVTSAGSTVHFAIVLPRDSTQKDSSGAADSLGDAITGAVFGGKGFTFRLHAPHVTATNGKTDSVTKTVEWNVPLSQLKHSTTREFTAEITLSEPVTSRSSDTALLWIGLAILAVVGIFISMRRRKGA